ncbi:MAG: hypothetical protein ACJ76N_28515 [Thermoanaerobaculia bacterium]
MRPTRSVERTETANSAVPARSPSEAFCGIQKNVSDTIKARNLMETFLTMAKTYSPAVAVLLITLAAIALVLREAVKTAVTNTLELRLKRRSAFEDKVLSDRFSLIIGLSTRLERIMTNLNRRRAGQTIPDGFINLNEIVPLTEIFEDLIVHRLVLAEQFYDLFRRKAELASRAANINAQNEQEWSSIAKEWEGLRGEARAATEEAFGISKIKW